MQDLTPCNSHYIHNNTKFEGDEEWVRNIGRWNYLRDKHNLSIQWRKDHWSASWYVVRQGKAFQSNNDPNISRSDYDTEGKFLDAARETSLYWSPSTTTHTFNIGYNTNEYGSFSLNVQNPFNEDPTFYNTTKGYDRGIGIKGRYYTLSWSYEFK